MQEIQTEAPQIRPLPLAFTRRETLRVRVTERVAVATSRVNQIPTNWMSNWFRVWLRLRDFVVPLQISKAGWTLQRLRSRLVKNLASSVVFPAVCSTSATTREFSLFVLSTAFWQFFYLGSSVPTFEVSWALQRLRSKLSKNLGIGNSLSNPSPRLKLQLVKVLSYILSEASDIVIRLPSSHYFQSSLCN